MADKKPPRSRCWFLEINPKSLETLVKKEKIDADSLSDPEKLGNQLQACWEQSANGRTAAVAVCESAEGLFHAHIALYNTSNALSRSVVSNFFGKAHADPQQGTKEQVQAYLEKTGKFEEKGEKVLYTIGLEKLQDARKVSQKLPSGGIESSPTSVKWAMWKAMIDTGISINDIINADPSAIPRKNDLKGYVDDILKNEYLNKVRDIRTIYVQGPTRTGKTSSIYARHSYKDVYATSDSQKPFDNYEHQPVVLFDEFRSEIPYRDMLKYLDRYPLMLKARYYDRVACYSTVYLVSNWSLEKQYEELKTNDSASYRAFLARIHQVEVHKGANKLDLLNIDRWYDSLGDSKSSAAERWYKEIDRVQGVLYYESTALYFGRDQYGIPQNFPDDLKIEPMPPEFGF